MQIYIIQYSIVTNFPCSLAFTYSYSMFHSYALRPLPFLRIPTVKSSQSSRSSLVGTWNLRPAAFTISMKVSTSKPSRSMSPELSWAKTGRNWVAWMRLGLTKNNWKRRHGLCCRCSWNKCVLSWTPFCFICMCDCIWFCFYVVLSWGALCISFFIPLSLMISPICCPHVSHICSMFR